jgi:hypothetical protein
MAKARQKIEFDPTSMFSGAIKQIKKEELESKGKILDIVSFAKEVLGEDPFPAQEIILKFFYAGTNYNENLTINDDDIKLIEKWSIPHHWLLHGEKSKIKLLKERVAKFKKDPSLNYFKNLVLVIGRRSGKSWMSSLIAVYEAYKLISLKDPLKHFGVDNDIWIINTAVTGDQAKTIIFKLIRKFAHRCALFEGRICKETEDTLILYTDADLELNEKIKKSGGTPINGSVVIASGNSNAPGLRGHTSTMIIYDEMAHYVDSSGKASSKLVYNALSKSCANLYKFGEGRNIMISSPLLPSGFFYEQFESLKEEDMSLVFQIPTWDINPNITREMLEPEFKQDPILASAEYGAQFIKGAKNQYFPAELVDSALRRRENWYKRDQGDVNKDYYLHIDPSKNSDRWAILICHPEFKFDDKSNTWLPYIVEDYSKAFSPEVGCVLDPSDIMDNAILPLFKKFKIVSVTSDQFFTYEQQKKLWERGINFRETPFNGVMKNKMYETCRDYFINERIILCNDDIDLAGELKNITIDYTRNPPKLDKSNDDKSYPHDDLVDCLCGTIYSILQGSKGITRLPRPRAVYTGRR